MKKKPKSLQVDMFNQPKPIVPQIKKVLDDILPTVEKDNKGFIVKKPLEQIAMPLVVEEKPKEVRIKPIEFGSLKKVSFYSGFGSIIGLSFRSPFKDGYSREEWLKDLELFNLKYTKNENKS